MHQRRPTHRSNLEKLTLWHIAFYVVGATWMFGGRIDWARPPLIIWGLLGAVITILSIRERRQRGAPVKRWLIWLAPALLLATWVLLSSFNASMEFFWRGEAQFFQPIDHRAWLPSSVKPELTRTEGALMFGMYLAAFNLALNTSQLRTLRHLLIILGSNAVALALFGIVQKMAGTDMFFGLQESPNKSFFASFIYHNHWGPFVLLNIAGWFALIEPLSRHDRGRGVLHSPALSAMLAIVVLAVTIPLSTSRSSTVMLSVLFPTCSLWVLWRLGRQRIKPIARRWLLLIGLLGVFGCAGAAYWMAGDTIQARLQITREQISDMREMGGLGQRARVYHDTWTMIQMRPLAGWGLECYAFVYRRYNTEPLTIEGWPVQFNEAHSDWLQLWLETGAVGLLLFLLCLGIPLWGLRHRLFSHPFAGCFFICLLLLAAQASVEFPFANPAVTLSAWVAFFTALRFLQLHGSQVQYHHHHEHSRRDSLAS